MPCQLIFGNSLDTMVDHRVDKDRAHPSPFLPETIVVSGNGLRRWLSFELARRRGILAHTHFTTPHTFVQQLLRDALGKAEDPAFAVEAMIPRLFARLKDLPGDEQSELAIPADYLRDQPDLTVLQFARRLADLFDQYLTYRPDWIKAWEAGHSALPANHPAGRHERWQRFLWLHDFAPAGKHRAHLYNELIQTLHKGPVPHLPPQLTVFGTHTLPPVFLAILKALGTFHQVDILLTQPTPRFWSDQVNTTDNPNQSESPHPHPLLAAWGVQGRDLFNLLLDHDLFSSEADDQRFFSPPATDSLLGTVQRSLYDLQPEPALPPPDDSLRIHCCHHPLRELEVLRDQLLHFFQQDPQLRPDQVLVLAPDINTYAPLIEAVFGHNTPDQPSLPFSIADRHFRSASRLVDTFYRLLDLCQSRFTAPEVFALFQSPPFRARFHWDEDDLRRIRQWLTAAGVAWGSDAAHRAELGLPAFSAYSWHHALQRLFLGYAVRPRENPATDQQLDAPCDVLEGQDSRLLGSLAEAWQLIHEAANALKGPLPASEWAQRLRTSVVDAFFHDLPDAGIELSLLRDGLDHFARHTENIQTAIDFPATIAFLESFIRDGIPSRGFLGHGITFASLTPMRAIPHQVVAVIGLQDGAFPRDPRHPAFDLMRHSDLQRGGDRTASHSDRFLFLETLLSARRCLHLSFCGFSARDDALTPPAVPVDELRRFLESNTAPDLPRSPRFDSPFVIEHRLQAHHPVYFSNEPEHRHFHAFSRTHFEAARIVAQNRPQQPPPPSSAEGPMPETDPPPVSLPQLLDFFDHPARVFCQQTLGLRVPAKQEELPASEPLVMDGLARYHHRLHAVYKALAWPPPQNQPPPLPPAHYGQWLAAEIQSEARSVAQQIHAAFPELAAPPAPPRLISLDLSAPAAPLHLTAECPHLHQNKAFLFRPAEQIKPKDKFHSWVTHLVLCATPDGPAPETVYIPWNPAKSLRLPPVSQELARDHLRRLLQLYHRGLQAPLPFFLEGSMAFAQNSSDPAKAFQAAENEWEPEFQNHNPPARDPWNLLLWHPLTPFETPFQQEFAECADAVFSPLLQNFPN